MHPDPREFDLREIVRALRRQWILVVVVTVAFVGGSLVRSFLEEPRYAASATVLVSQVSADDPLQSRSRSAAEAERLIQNELELMRSPAIRDRVRERLGRPVAVAVSGKPDSDAVTVRAVGTDPQEVAETATTYVEEYLAFRRETTVQSLLASGAEVQAKIDELDRRSQELESQVAQLDLEILSAAPAELPALREERRVLEAQLEAERETAKDQRAYYVQQRDRLELAARLNEQGGPRLIAAATVPSSPVSPSPVRDAGIALFVGVLVGCAAALLREYWDDSVKSKEDLEAVGGGLSVVAMIPQVAGWKDRRATELVSVAQPSSPAAEAYRTLRTSVKFLGIHRPITSVQVTSAVAGEGKTTTVANLAVAFARSGARVVAVCCDFRRPRLHEFFDLPNVAGFTSVLAGDVSLQDAVQRVPGEDRLLVLTAGPVPPNPAELLSSSRASAAIGVLAENADLVVIDSPPVLPVTDAIVLAGMVDATLLVAATGVTHRRAFARSVEILEQVDAPIVGAVLNGVGSDGGYGGSYAYDLGYAPLSPAGGPGGPAGDPGAASRAATMSDRT